MANNVIPMHRFVGSNDFVPPTYRPHIKLRGGMWRVDRLPLAEVEPDWREGVSEANQEALLFAVYLNQFLPGGCFGEKETTTQTP